MTGKRPWWAIKLTLCLTLLLPMAALAAPPPEGYGAASLRIAEEYWGPAPLCKTESIEWGVGSPEYPTREGAATVATHPEFECRMWINHPTIGVYRLCLVVVHEYGHWIGNGWGTDPHSVTYDGDEANEEWRPPFIQRCIRLTNFYQEEVAHGYAGTKESGSSTADGIGTARKVAP